MVSKEYLSDVHETLIVMESSLHDVRKRVDMAMQRGEWNTPEWHHISKAAVKLARQCLKLATDIGKAEIQQN